MPKQICKKDFQHATRGNYAKPVLPFDKDKRVKSSQGQEADTFVWAVGAALQLYRGLLLLLQSDILVPSAHMMNESPCNRSNRLILSLQQTKRHPLHCDHLSAFYIPRTNQKGSRSIPIHQLARAGNNLPFTATNIITSWDLPWNYLGTPGCSICCSSLIRQQVCFQRHTAAHTSACQKEGTHGFTLHFFFLP